MKNIQAILIALFTCVISTFLFSCGSDDDESTGTNNITVTLQQTSFSMYQPSGTISIPVKLSDSSAQLTASDVELSVVSASSTSRNVNSNVSIPISQLFSLANVKKGDEAGIWNIEVDVNLNNLEEACIVLGVNVFDREVGNVTFQCYRAHQLDVQTIQPRGKCTFNAGSLLTAENATLDYKNMLYGEIKQDGSYTLNNVSGQYYTIGTFESATGEGERGFSIRDLGYMVSGQSYTFIVRLQRTENASDGYVWFELPVICKKAQ